MLALACCLSADPGAAPVPYVLDNAEVSDLRAEALKRGYQKKSGRSRRPPA